MRQPECTRAEPNGWRRGARSDDFCPMPALGAVMSGIIAIYRGYRILRRGEELQVDYQRRTVNPHLPRTFTWTDRRSPADLHGYIDALLAQNARARRRYERQGSVQHLVWDSPLAIPSTAPVGRVRMGLDWLAEILAGRERCTVPRHAWIEVRTNKDGCQLNRLQAWRAEHRVVTPVRHRLEARYHATHAAGAFLAMMPNWWLFQGWGLQLDQQRLRCTRLVPRYSGTVSQFSWIGPDDDRTYRTLRNLLTALNAGSQEAARQAEDDHHITDVEHADLDAAAPWIVVSPVRLAALLSGDDVLRIHPEGLVRTRPWRGQRQNVAWHASMVDTALVPWHAAVVRGAQWLGMRDLSAVQEYQRQRDERKHNLELLRAVSTLQNPVQTSPISTRPRR